MRCPSAVQVHPITSCRNVIGKRRWWLGMRYLLRPSVHTLHNLRVYGHVVVSRVVLVLLVHIRHWHRRHLVMLLVVVLVPGLHRIVRMAWDGIRICRRASDGLLLSTVFTLLMVRWW